MRAHRFLRIDNADLGLRVAGVALALGSSAFAALMVMDPNRKPEITGLEHLAIYARPTKSVAQKPQLSARANVDYTPVGTTRSAFPDSSLVGYDLLAVSSEEATIRTPQGRVTRVTPGARLPGVGEIVSIHRREGKWVVITQSGLIQQH